MDAAQAEFGHADQLTDTREDEYGKLTRQRATVRDNLGLVAQMRGELEAAEAYHKESLALYREVGDCHDEAQSLNNLGNVAGKRGELRAGEAYFEESLAFKRKVGDRHSEALTLHRLGVIAVARDDLVLAEEHLEAAIELLQENDIIGDALDVFPKLIEWCEQAIAFAEQTEHNTECEQFQDRLSDLLDTDE